MTREAKRAARELAQDVRRARDEQRRCPKCTRVAAMVRITVSVGELRVCRFCRWEVVTC